MNSETQKTGRVLCCYHSDRKQQLRSSLADEGISIDDITSLEAYCQSPGPEAYDACIVSEQQFDAAQSELSLKLRQGERLPQFIKLQGGDDHQPEERATLPMATIPVFARLNNAVSAAELSSVVSSAVAYANLQDENRRLKQVASNRIHRELTGHSSAVQKLRTSAIDAAQKDSAVLISGEPGTGTNLLAQLIHDSGRRAHRSFLKINCKTLSSEALERELIGTAVTTETGNKRIQHGRLELATGGTLLLDNVESLSLPIQKKLLQFIEQRTWTSGITGESLPLDVRILAATHIDLQDQCRRGLFLEELYQHLSAITILTPTLLDRHDDIGLLSEQFLIRLSVAEGRPLKRMTIEALEYLKGYHWPGNIRELQNVIDRACSLDSDSKLTADMLRPWMNTSGDDVAEARTGLSIKEMERKLIETTFARYSGNREKTARSLEIGLRTLSGKLREYGYPPRGGPGSNRKDDTAAKAA